MRGAKIAIIVCLFAGAAIAAAQATCSTEMLQGTYAVEHAGLVYIAGVTAPYSLLGTITADRDGNVESRWVQVNPFATLRYTQTGSWTVTGDCKVTLTHVQNGTVAGTSEGLVIHNGDEIRMMLINPLERPVPAAGKFASVGSGILRRMTPGANEVANCSVRTLRGTFAKTCAGYLTQTGASMTFMPVRGSLTVTAHGDGTAEGNGNLAFDKLLHPGEYVDLTYTVEPGCWATATFKIKDSTGNVGESRTEDMVIFDHGKELISTTSKTTDSSSISGQVDICRYTRVGN